MKTLAIMFGAAALAGGVHYLQNEGHSLAVAGRAGFSGEYRLAANGGEAVCILRRGARLAGGLSRLTADADCRSVMPGMERARFWREKADGTVVLSANGIDPIARFGIGDGIDYVSYAPAAPLLSLAAVR